MIGRLWEKSLREGRNIFEKEEIVGEIGEQGLNEMLRVGVLRHLSIEEYPYCVGCFCPDGREKEIVFINGRAFGHCVDWPDEEMTPIDLTQWGQYRVEKGRILSLLIKNSGLKGGVERREPHRYALGYWRTVERKLHFIFTDSLGLGKGDIMGMVVDHLGRDGVVILTHEQAIFEEVACEFIVGQSVYLVKIEDFIDWEKGRLNVRGILDFIGAESIHLTDEMKRKQEECGFLTVTRIDIDGKKMGGKKYRVVIEGERKGIGKRSLVLLAELAERLTRDEDCGWVSIEDLIEGGQISGSGRWQYMSRLRDALGDKDQRLIETDGRGHYRLSTLPELVHLNFTRLEKLSD